MDSIQFNMLRQHEQLRTVARHGTLLFQYKRHKLLCRLYGIQNLYIEIINNPASNEIIAVMAYKDLDNIEHILREIDISGLVP